MAIKRREYFHMIRVILSDLMGRLRWKQSELARATSISLSTINSLYHDKAKQISFKHLELICAALECDVHDIIIREAESMTWSARIDTLYAMALGTQTRLLEHERAGNTADAQYLKGQIRAYALIADDFFGIDEGKFHSTVEKGVRKE
jgi:putative transcriptional regulator